LGELPEHLFEPLSFAQNFDAPNQFVDTLADRCKKALASFDVEAYKNPDTGNLVFVTAFSQRPELSQADERPKRMRKIAYRVELSSPRSPGLVRLNLSADIKWRLVIDPRFWYAENPTSSKLYLQSVTLLKKQILGE
jgi:hypothetical protein